MKKIIFLALVTLLGIHTVDAQRRGGTCTPEQIVEKLDKKLNLTDEQEKQITELYTEFFKKELLREERRSMGHRTKRILRVGRKRHQTY